MLNKNRGVTFWLLVSHLVLCINMKHIAKVKFPQKVAYWMADFKESDLITRKNILFKCTILAHYKNNPICMNAHTHL